MTIYISGKIGERVVSDETRMKFDRVQEKLEAAGHQVFNPTSTEWQEYLRKWMKGRERYLETHNISEYAEALRLDLSVISECHAIYMLPDFLESPGAMAEYAFAKACEKTVIYDDELNRDGNLRDKALGKIMFPWGIESGTKI